MIMNKKLVLMTILAVACISAAAQEFNPIPRAWKWIDKDEVIFTYDGTYADSTAFVDITFTLIQIYTCCTLAQLIWTC